MKVTGPIAEASASFARATGFAALDEANMQNVIGVAFGIHGREYSKEAGLTFGGPKADFA